MIGIDISRESIKVAQQNSKNTHLAANYVVMNGEQMNFSDNKFDLIVDYGTFSSLDMQLALPELIRVIKPNGTIIAVETLGHDPLFNLKRKLNLLQGRRTAWAARHIMKMSDWQRKKVHFHSVEIDYFGLTSLIIAPIIRLFPEKIQTHLMRICATMDRKLFKVKMMRPYAFKTVVQLHPTTASVLLQLR